MESRPRTPDSALQILRLPDGLVASSRPCAARCPAHPPTAGASHGADGSTHVRSVALQRQIRRGAIESSGELRELELSIGRKHPILGTTEQRRATAGTGWREALL